MCNNLCTTVQDLRNHFKKCRVVQADQVRVVEMQAIVDRETTKADRHLEAHLVSQGLGRKRKSSTLLGTNSSSIRPSKTRMSPGKASGLMTTNHAASSQSSLSGYPMAPNRFNWTDLFFVAIAPSNTSCHQDYDTGAENSASLSRARDRPNSFQNRPESANLSNRVTDSIESSEIQVFGSQANFSESYTPDTPEQHHITSQRATGLDSEIIAATRSTTYTGTNDFSLDNNTSIPHRAAFSTLNTFDASYSHLTNLQEGFGLNTATGIPPRASFAFTFDSSHPHNFDPDI